MHIIIIHLMYWLKVMKRDLPLKVIGADNHMKSLYNYNLPSTYFLFTAGSWGQELLPKDPGVYQDWSLTSYS